MYNLEYNKSKVHNKYTTKAQQIEPMEFEPKHVLGHLANSFTHNLSVQISAVVLYSL